MSALTIEFGGGAAVTVVDKLLLGELERMLDVVRSMFEDDDARAEGWKTSGVDERDGFRAEHGRLAVTFRLA